MPESGASQYRTGSTTSLGLLAGIQANESQAWERFIALYTPLFDYWLRQANVPEHDFADLRQDTFMAVARSLKSYEHEPGRGAFRGWLRTILLNKLIDYRRKRIPQPNTEAVATLAMAEPGDLTAEQKILYRRALELIRTDFEPNSWQAFWLVVVEERAPADVAAELGLTLNAVYLAKGRVLRRLREEFAELLGDVPSVPLSNQR